MADHAPWNVTRRWDERISNPQTGRGRARRGRIARRSTLDARHCMRPSSLVVVLLLSSACAASPAHAADSADSEVRALRGVKIYPAPDAAPIDDGVVLIRDGRITAVGKRDESTDRVPALAAGCDGGVLMAGFQNSHVHFIGSEFANAKTAPAASLAKALTRMLTQYGYTTAFDIASDRDNTLALRARVNSGELKGPRILTTGWPLFPHDGLPIYLEGQDPAFLAKLPQPDTVASALATVKQNLDAGTDATKLFLVTPQAHRTVKRMPDDIAAAAAAETHRRGKLVFAHPTDLDGIRAALRAKVDILAHPPLGTPGPWPTALMDQIRADGVSMIPTLKLLRYELAKEHVPADEAERILQDSVHEFGKFAAAGGNVLFGTDVEYMTDTDPTDEYELMARAGMSTMQILASLTTAPAARWNETQRHGRIAPGQDADLVVLAGDPAQAPGQFANVKCTVRGGSVIFAK
jgi:imidazolonepropionase-like amidohydrolase